MPGVVIAGAPVPCTGCKRPFRPSMVLSSPKAYRNVLCPRCTKTAKAEKQRKKGKK